MCYLRKFTCYRVSTMNRQVRSMTEYLWENLKRTTELTNLQLKNLDFWVYFLS